MPSDARFGYDLGINLLAGFIGYGTALAKAQLWDRRSYRNERRFWRERAGRRLLVVYPMYNGEFGSRFPRNMARVEDVAAAQMIAEAAEAVGRDPVLANDEEPIEAKADLVLVCSPKGNRRSQEVAGAVALPFAYEVFSDRPSEIVNRASRTRYVSDPIGTGERNDFALLARVSDPEHDRRVYCLWGIRGIGTLGAARFASHSPYLAEVNRAAGSGDFAVVLRVVYQNPLKPKTVVPESQIIPIRPVLPGRVIA